MPVNKLTCWVVFIGLIFFKLLAKHGGRGDGGKCPGGVLEISLGGEVRRGPSYPDPL